VTKADIERTLKAAIAAGLRPEAIRLRIDYRSGTAVLDTAGAAGRVAYAAEEREPEGAAPMGADIPL
jgi:hypothetical protein